MGTISTNTPGPHSWVRIKVVYKSGRKEILKVKTSRAAEKLHSDLSGLPTVKSAKILPGREPPTSEEVHAHWNKS